MRKFKFYMVLIIFFSSCMAQKELTKVSFIHISSNQEQQKKTKYFMQIPKGYVFERLVAGGEVGIEDRYVYLDSSLLYISNFEITPNENNIKKQGHSGIKLEFSMNQNKLNVDTLVLEGQNKEGLYWKEIMIGQLEFGYLNISFDNKKVFDTVLESLSK